MHLCARTCLVLEWPDTFVSPVLGLDDFYSGLTAVLPDRSPVQGLSSLKLDGKVRFSLALIHKKGDYLQCIVIV